MLKLYFLIFVFSISFAAFDQNTNGAKSNALGNAVVSHPDLIYAVYYNPANIKHHNQFRIAFDYRNFYGLPEVNQLSLVCTFPFHDFPISFGAVSFGNKLYTEMQFLLGSSYKLNSDISIGSTLRFYTLQIEGYGSDFATGINLGVQYRLTSDFSIGFLISNLNRPTISRQKEKIAQCFVIGFSYAPMQEINLFADLYRDVRYEQDYRAGISYIIMPEIEIRIGLEDKINTYSIGFGTAINNFVFDYALSVHQVLGISHLFSFMVEI